MSFTKLLDTERGQILLANLHETWAAKLIAPHVCAPALRELRDGLAALADPSEVDSVFKAAIFSNRNSYQLAATERPDPAIVIAVVRPLEEIVSMLRELRNLATSAGGGTVVLTDEEMGWIDSALAKDPEPDALVAVAEILTRHAPPEERFALGHAWNLFWGTDRQELLDVVAEAKDLGNVVRDKLGLIQFEPLSDSEPCHLFAFECKGAIETVVDRPKMARPTTFDGFDNPRFRQLRPRRARKPSRGCGLTVDMTNGEFGDGLREYVSRRIKINGQFTCRYLAPVTKAAKGGDSHFLAFLNPSGGLRDLANDLDRAAA